MIACPYQDLFPFINNAIQQKLNTEWNEKYEKNQKTNQIPGHGKKIKMKKG